MTKTVCDSARYTGRSYRRSDGREVWSRCVLWDSEQSGFGLRVTPAGERSFIVRYHVNGRPRVMALGRYGDPLTVQDARRRAARIRDQAHDGRDQLAEREEARRAPLLRDVAPDFLAQVRSRRKPSTASGYEWILQRVVFPKLGGRRITDLTRRDVMRFHAALADRPYLANRAVAVLSALCTFAERAGIIAANPCARAVEKYRERPRQRFLTPAELARLGTVLAEVEVEGESPLFLVGCRVGPSPPLVLLAPAAQGVSRSSARHLGDLDGRRTSAGRGRLARFLWAPDLVGGGGLLNSGRRLEPLSDRCQLSGAR